MRVNNEVYDQPDSWWRDDRPFATLQEFTPARFAYFHDVLTRRLRMDLNGLSVLDIGCGGGLLAEEFTRAGCRVTGIDPSRPSLDAAAKHAAGQGLDITYQQGTAEQLPFPDHSFDLVYCCDTLEHVTDVDRAVAEAVRVLRPGGHYLYDTINRTFASWLVMVKMAQDWPAVSWAEKDLHVWRQFIKPDELYRIFGRHGLRNQGQAGFSSSRRPLEVLRLLRRRARGHISYGELGREFRLGTSTDISVIYAGYARKTGGSADAGL